MNTARSTTHHPDGNPAPPNVRLPIEFTAFCELHRRRYLRYAMLHTGDEVQAHGVVQEALGELVTHWYDALASPSVAAYAWPLLKRHIDRHTAQVPDNTLRRRIPSELSDEALLRHGLQLTDVQIAETTGRRRPHVQDPARTWHR